MQELQPTGFQSDHIAFFPILLLLLELKSKKFWFMLVFFLFLPSVSYYNEFHIIDPH